MDLNMRAFRVVQAAIAEPATLDKRKESARKGGLAGGPSRARLVSAERRSEIAKKTSGIKWDRKPVTERFAASTAELKIDRSV